MFGFGAKKAEVSVFDEMKKYDSNPVWSRYGGCESFHRMVASGELFAWDEIANEDGSGTLLVFDVVSPKYLKAVR